MRERMSHATDGELHAYLDGALGSIDRVRADRLRIHLEGCSDCTARLEDARALRARASQILADAEPGSAEVPPFEAILERRAWEVGPREAEASRGGDGSPLIPIRRARPPLAWAASVAVALGAGWLGHAMWTGTRIEDTAGVPVAQGPAVAGEAEGARSRERASNLDLAEGASGRLSSEAREPTPAGSLERLADELPDDAPAGSGARADREEQTRLETRAVEPAERQEETARPAASELRAPPGRLEEPSATGVVRRAANREDRAPEGEPVPEPTGPPAEGNEALRDLRKTDQDTLVAVRLQDDATVVGRDAEAGRRRPADARGEFLAADRAFGARLLGGDLSWLPVSHADAEHWIDGPVLEVPGLDSARLAISTLGEVRLVRSVQTLPGGETLELIQETLPTDEAVQARDAIAATPAAPPGFEADYARASGPVLVVERDGFRITARAQVAADSLAILLSRLR